MRGIKITDDAIAKAKELAAAGLPREEIAKHCKFSVTTIKNNPTLKEAIREGRASFKEAVALAYFDKLESGDASTIIDAIKRFRVFSEPVPLPKPKCAKDAKEVLEKALELYAAGKLSENQFRTITRWTSAYVAVTNSVEIEARLEKLEEAYNVETKAHQA